MVPVIFFAVTLTEPCWSGSNHQTPSLQHHALTAAHCVSPVSCRYKDCTGKSVENLEREKASKAALEGQNKAQVEFNCELQEELAQLRAQLAMSQTGAQRQAGKAADIEAQRARLEVALQAAEQRLRDGELVRRKLHNTILVRARPPGRTPQHALTLPWRVGPTQLPSLPPQELKGNIRVFCRVRPLTLDNPMTETVDGKPLIQFPTSGAPSLTCYVSNRCPCQLSPVMRFRHQVS